MSALARFCAVVLAVGALTETAAAEPGRLYSYPVGIGQTGPRGSLARGPDGTLYAALYGLGPSSRGSVVAYVPPATVGANWTVSLLHGFNEPEGGRYPQGGVTLGPAGELYGTTVQGGANDGGIVFRLTPPATPGEPWTKDILHEFGLSPASYPSTNLLLGPDGALYGVTEGGGASSCGVAFRLKPRRDGALPWTFKVLASFAVEVGCAPRSTLLRDGEGNLYGTLFGGGPAQSGAVYRLQPTASGGGYKLKILKSFKDENGLGSPMGDLVFDAFGGLIGAARYGGGGECGGIYRLAPPATGDKWTYQKIRTLPGQDGGGCFPLGVARDPATGALAVTTYQGGAFNVGALLKLAPQASGPTSYKLKVREYFGPSYNYPQGSPIVGPDGAVYGSTTDAISIWRSAP